MTLITSTAFAGNTNASKALIKSEIKSYFGNVNYKSVSRGVIEITNKDGSKCTVKSINTMTDTDGVKRIDDQAYNDIESCLDYSVDSNDDGKSDDGSYEA